MKVTIDASRILHLFLLITLSAAGAIMLVSYLEWTPLAAFGLSCTVVTQVSNLFLTTNESKKALSSVVPATTAMKGNPKKQKSRNAKSKGD